MDDINIIEIVSGFAVIFIVLLIWILNQIIKINKTVSVLSENVGRIDERVKNNEKNIEKLTLNGNIELINIFLKMLDKSTKSNPVSISEKKALLEKFKIQTLSKDEAERLRAIIEKEKEKAEKSNNLGIVILAGLLLGALSYFTYKMFQKE